MPLARVLLDPAGVSIQMKMAFLDAWKYFITRRRRQQRSLTALGNQDQAQFPTPASVRGLNLQKLVSLTQSCLNRCALEWRWLKKRFGRALTGAERGHTSDAMDGNAGRCAGCSAEVYGMVQGDDVVAYDNVVALTDGSQRGWWTGLCWFIGSLW